MVPPASSKSTQDGPKPGQDGLRSTQDGSKTVLKSVVVAVQNRLRFDVVWGRFGIDFGSLWPLQMRLFWHPFGASNRSKFNSKLDYAKGRSKIAQRAPKTLPRRPLIPPGHPQDPPRHLPEPPWTPPDARKCIL